MTDGEHHVLGAGGSIGPGVGTCSQLPWDTAEPSDGGQAGNNSISQTGKRRCREEVIQPR